MTAYVVTAGYVTVETERPGGGRAAIDIPRGQTLPDDVSQEQIDWELKLHTIEAVSGQATSAPSVPEALPEDLSVAATLTWVGDDKARAQTALDAETSETGKGRATLVDRLQKVLATE